MNTREIELTKHDCGCFAEKDGNVLFKKPSKNANKSDKNFFFATNVKSNLIDELRWCLRECKCPNNAELRSKLMSLINQIRAL